MKKEIITELEKCILAKEKGYKYNPVTGEITGMRGRVINGKKHNYIYCQISKNGVFYEISAHRLAWFLYYGETPKNFIDHIDCNTLNNKIDNLRDVTNKQNQWNQANPKGYTFNKKNKTFCSKIRVNGKPIYLGSFKTEEEAKNAYLNAKKKYHVIQ